MIPAFCIVLVAVAPLRHGREGGSDAVLSIFAIGGIMFWAIRR